ncbi:MAG: PAS domain S-box protein, partial [Candidatus Omnitrophica bacterium]|nr:PAS domain S-box protein [Candidatus Omnitrophota bacterium]
MKYYSIKTKGIRLQTKIFFTISALIVVSMGATSYFLLNNIRKNMVDSFRDRGLLLATEFAKKIAEGILIEDLQFLKNSADKLKTYPDVGYLNVYGELNTNLVKRIFIAGTFENNKTLKSLPSSTSITSLLREKKRKFPVLEILTPITYENETIGAVQLGMSLDRIDKEIMNRTKSSVFLVTVFILLSLMISYFLSLSITQPINSLVSSVKMISAGKLSHIVESTDKNELGELADSINKMTADLRNTTVSINILKKEQQRFRDVAESSGDWIWEVDSDGRYVYSNHTVENILGYKSEDILGKFFYDFYPLNEQEAIKNIIFEAFDNKNEVKDLINFGVKKDGNIINIITAGVPILDNEGNMIGYRGVNRDITKNIQAANEKEN